MDIKQALINKESFYKGSVKAFITLYHDEQEYVVLSYAKQIARYSFINKKWEIDYTRYSQTTSKIQNILKEIEKIEVLNKCFSL